MKKNLLFIFFLLLANFVFAQNGFIRGTVTDAENGEALIGVTVIIDGTSTGTPTDLDGKYSLSLAPGTYSLKVSYISYETKVITGIEVKAGQVSVMNVTLGTSSDILEEIVVEAKAERNSEIAILTMQKNSSVVMDGISSQTFAKTGDNDAGAAIRRVTGVSVEGGKYVYVRGLGDRYTKTTLNNTEIPSLDPNRNAVQLDIFPANLIDNLAVTKTYSADLPGDFTGGLINIVTKDFPTSFTFQWSSNFAYNTNATFNDDFLLYEGSKTDWLGFDDGLRALPASAEGEIPGVGLAQQNAAAATQLDNITRSFTKVMEPTRERTPFLNQRHAVSVGNQIEFLGRPLGFIVGLSYQLDYDFYDNGVNARYAFSGANADALRTIFAFDDATGQEKVLWGALANISYKLADNHKLSLNVLRNQSGTSQGRSQVGSNPQNFEGDDIFLQTRTVAYAQRSFTTFQLKGDHAIPSLSGLKIDWHSAYSSSSQDEPDLRFFANDVFVSGTDSTFTISPSIYPQPARFFRELDEYNLDNKLNFTLNYRLFNGLESKLKFGGSYLFKDRFFTERRLSYVNNRFENSYFGSVSDYISDANIGIVGTDAQGNSLFGPAIQDLSEDRNTYDATQTVIGAYLLTDLQISEKLKANIGIRLETTNIEVISKDTDVDQGKLDNVDLLPAVNLIYELKKDMNLRASYSRTIARPTFREIAPFTSFDFIGDFLLVGNPALKRSLIDNLDLRWEMYPSSGELISVSLFYKAFDDPIERAFDLRAQNPQITFRNVDNANIYGAELELRKRLGFISPTLNNLQVGLNATYVQSEVDLDEQEAEQIRNADPTAPSTRRLFAQSPYLVNALLDYNNPNSGTELSISYNIFGERLAVVSAGQTPDVFERPRNTLNFSFRQSFGIDKRWKATFRVNNILNAKYRYVYKFKNQEFEYQNYQLGVDFSVGITYSIEK